MQKSKFIVKQKVDVALDENKSFIHYVVNLNIKDGLSNDNHLYKTFTLSVCLRMAGLFRYLGFFINSIVCT